MNTLAEEYVRIVLGVGEHDSDYVDAYYGPAEWREEVHQQKPALATLRSRAGKAMQSIASLSLSDDEMEQLRQRYLQKQLSAVVTRIDMLSGKHFPFDEESQLLYDAVSPHHDATHYQRLLDDIDRELLGSGST